MNKVGNILIHTLMIVMAIIFLIPFYILIRNALMTNPEISSFDWIFFPKDPQWNNFVELFSDPFVPMWTGLRNSAIISISTLVFLLKFWKDYM